MCAVALPIVITSGAPRLSLAPPPMRLRPILTLLLSASPALAAATAGAQARTTRYVAPTDETVTTSIEEGYGGTPSQVIWIRNASSVPIQVYSVTLRDCQNVKQECAPYPLRLVVRPGGREVLRRVQPRNPEAGVGFRYTFGWRADSSAVAALHALADNGSATAQQQLAAREQELAERRADVGSHDQMLGQDEIAALGARIAGLRVEPDSVVVHVGQLFLVHQVRLVAVGPDGEVLGRVRAYNWRVQPGARGVVTMLADTVVAQRVGRTTADFRLAPPAAPLTATLPIVVVPDSTR